MQLKYKFVSTIITLFYENNQSTSTSWTKYLEYPKKINPNAIGFGNGTISNNKIDGFKERIENVTTLIEHRCSEGCRGFF
jgi:hypothetical protein